MLVNKFGKAALEAVKLLENKIYESPRDAWEKATEKIFGEGSSSQQKGFPRGAFLGLCEEGMVKGVVSGNYCRSNRNKDYAIKAVKLLKKFPELIKYRFNFKARAIFGHFQFIIL